MRHELQRTHIYMTESNDDSGQGLLPGSKYKCDSCGQCSELTEHASALWCGSCGEWVCEYDLVDHDRVYLGPTGQMEGRGHGVRRGRKPSGSSIGGSGSVSEDQRRKWNRLRYMDREGRQGPTRNKVEAIGLLRAFSTTDAHLSMALDLLDLGWPDKGANRVMKAASEKPIWSAGHPCGVGSSAAACLHASAARMGFDSKLSDWVELCLPGKKYGVKYSFRSLKRLTVILGEAERSLALPDSVAGSILSRAELGRTQYGHLVPRIWESWRFNTHCQDSNLVSHARPVLAAICEMVARDEGVDVDRGLIADRFNVGLGYWRWRKKLVI